MVEIVKIRMAGGSPVVTIPARFMIQLGWTPGRYVALSPRGQSLTIVPIAPPTFPKEDSHAETESAPRRRKAPKSPGGLAEPHRLAGQ
ncbi:MAG: AbrB/MazE/SpoVT family DNA-binding domain-containing protein [Pseudomonadota bacterium]